MITMKRTAIYERHKENDGRLIDFFGWEMPLHFKSGIIQEHKAVRTSVGLFDVSHMGNLLIFDKEENGIQRLVTNDVSNVPNGKCVYTHLSDEGGKIIDDLIITKLDKGVYFCVPNASMTDIIRDWMRAHSKSEIIDVSLDLTCVAVQGPMAKDLLTKSLQVDIEHMDKFVAKAFDHSEMDFADLTEITKSNLKDNIGIISTTGYTGEDGYEAIIPNEHALGVWDKLINCDIGSAILPIGLGARDTLRLEMGYLLSGQDFHGDRTSLETNCSWVIKWDHEFIGRSAMEELKAMGTHQKMIGIELEGKAPVRTGATVHLPESPHEIVGSVSSGNFAPSLGHSIALAYMNRPYHKPGIDVMLKYHGKEFRGVTKKTPFLRK